MLSPKEKRGIVNDSSVKIPNGEKLLVFTSIDAITGGFLYFIICPNIDKNVPIWYG